MTANKKPYHKENLRRDLIDAGHDYVKKNGHAGLSIRTLAQQVGVSPGAPYHHFPDRRSFLLALAADGFRQMLASSESAVRAKLPSAEKLRLMGTIFVRFADENAHLLDLMYESELTRPPLDPELQEFQLMGHRALRNLIEEAIPGISDGDTDIRVVAFWSAVYGFASMRNKGVLHPLGADTLSSVDIAEAVIDRAVLSALAPRAAARLGALCGTPDHHDQRAATMSRPVVPLEPRVARGSSAAPSAASGWEVAPAAACAGAASSACATPEPSASRRAGPPPGEKQSSAILPKS